MNLVTAAKVAGDWRTIWISLLSLLSVAAWAGDNRWMLKTGGAVLVQQIQTEQLINQIESLELQKVYTSDPQKLKMLQALINIKKTKIDSLKK